MRPRVIVTISLLAALAVTAALLQRRLDPEPTYLNRGVSLWVDDLNSTNAAVRAQAISALKHFGPRAVPPLVKAMRVSQSRLAKVFLPNWHNTSWFTFSRLNQARTQLRAAKALKEIGPTAAPAVLELFRDPDPAVQQAAVETLTAMGAPVVPMLVPVLAHAEPNARYCAAVAIGRLGADAAPAVPALIATLGDTDARVRSAAAGALGDIGPASRLAAWRLTRALHDADITVRFAALRAIDRIGPAAEPAVPTLVQMLERQDETMRAELIHALGRVGPGAKAAVPLLQRGMRDRDLSVRLESARSVWLVEQTADEVLPVLLALLEGNGLVFRCRTIEVLGEIGPAATNAVPMLLAFLSSNPPHDDRYAAAALTRIAPELAATVLKDKPMYWRRP